MSDDSDTIHTAAKRGDLEAVRRFVEVEKIDVNSRDGVGNTPLIEASRGSIETAAKPLVASVLSYLISKNADVNATRNASDRCTSLMLVSLFGNLDAVKALLEEGNATVNARFNHQQESSTALFLAMRSPEGINVIPILLQHGAEIRCKCMSFGYNAAAFGLVLNHCRGIMTNGEISDLYLLSEDDDENIALHLSGTVKFSRLLIEQPRRPQDGQLLAECRSQLLHENELGLRPLQTATREIARPGYWAAVYREIADYLESFESLALSIPGDDGNNNNVAACASKAQAKRNDCIAMQLNPALNAFQHSVAQEALDLVADATDSLDSIAHAILGYLSALDVMKRTD